MPRFRSGYWSNLRSIGRIKLVEIAGVIVTRLNIDNATKQHVFRNYARVLVDVDFSLHIFDEIMVERDGFAFKLGVAYEWLLEFFSHLLNDWSQRACTWLKHKMVVDKVDKIGREKKPTHARKQMTLKYVEKNDHDGIGSSKAFAAPITNKAVIAIVNEEHIPATISFGTDDTSNIQEKLHGELINTEELIVTNDHPTSHVEPPVTSNPHTS